MKQKIKIGNFEAFCLLINLFCSKLILDFPRNVAEEAGTAAWIMVLLVSVTVFVVFIVIAKIYKDFSNKDILDVAESGIGEAGKIIAGMLFMLQFLYLIPIVLREFAEDIKVVSLTTTPISILKWLGSVTKIYWWQERYNSVIVRIAEETKTLWIDIRSAFLRFPDFSELLCVDGIHPNRDGHFVIAEEIISFINSGYRHLLI